jgi:hypothetical protein
MKAYKLKYENSESAMADFINKGIYINTNDGLVYGEGVCAVVSVGLITLTDGVYDNEGNEVTPPTYIDGYHYDVLSEIDFNFGDTEIFPKNPVHGFYGF